MRERRRSTAHVSTQRRAAPDRRLKVCHICLELLRCTAGQCVAVRNGKLGQAHAHAEPRSELYKFLVFPPFLRSYAVGMYYTTALGFMGNSSGLSPDIHEEHRAAPCYGDGRGLHDGLALSELGPDTQIPLGATRLGVRLGYVALEGTQGGGTSAESGFESGFERGSRARPSTLGSCG